MRGRIRWRAGARDGGRRWPRGPATPRADRHLEPQARRRSPGIPRRQVGRVHRHHARLGQGQERHRRLDGELGRDENAAVDEYAREREPPALEPGREVPRLHVVATGGDRRSGVVARPAGRRGGQVDEHQGGRGRLRMVAGRQAPRAHDRRARPRGHGRRRREKEDGEADRHRSLPLQGRHHRLPEQSSLTPVPVRRRH